jgi:pterin-4a-carbinolamine dehydratase
MNWELVAQLPAQSETPPLPPPISGWPTPHITDEEISTYLVPLYARRWGVGYDCSPKPENKPQIRRKYGFKSFDAAVAFLNDVANIARAEQVHEPPQPFSHRRSILTDSSKPASSPLRQNPEKQCRHILSNSFSPSARHYFHPSPLLG